jgi:uncharacterized protein YutE (UPF0331/DUF86 family)
MKTMIKITTKKIIKPNIIKRITPKASNLRYPLEIVTKLANRIKRKINRNYKKIIKPLTFRIINQTEIKEIHQSFKWRNLFRQYWKVQKDRISPVLRSNTEIIAYKL